MRVPRNKLQPGDLLFFHPDISHVAMYIGDAMMVNAPAAGQRVSVQRIPWAYYAGAVRILSKIEENVNGTDNRPATGSSSSYAIETYAEDPRFITLT
jgi:cell wall-associated NlpC family hydrolase